LYFKPEGYETVRYPYSGLVGPEFKDKTIAHNNDVNENTPEQVTQILNENIRTWLTAETFKNHEGKDVLAGEADKFRDCLKADNYMVFSNTTSAKASNDKNKGDPAIPAVIAIESPHNAMHLAIGGFDVPKQGDYDKYAFANGDMGENETAAYDPIFFFHHCFIDYKFWRWQDIWSCTQDLGKIDPNDPGCQRQTDSGEWETVTLDTELTPFTVVDEATQTDRPMTSRVWLIC
jgi:tyrosinase